MSSDRCVRTESKGKGKRQAGFSLIEVLVAILVLLVGVVSLAQVVPMAIDLNARNLASSQALVVAERELEQIVRQPLSIQTSPGADYNFTDQDGQTVNVGVLPSVATLPPNQAPPAPAQKGCPMVNNQIDFTQACSVANYTKTVVLGGRSFEVRWNVLTVYGNNRGNVVPVNKRISIAANSAVRSLTPYTLSVLVTN